MNHYVAIGNVTRKPELKRLEDAVVLKIGIATNEKKKTKSGEYKDEACFVDVDLWNKNAEWLAENLTVGALVSVTGSLSYEQWEDKVTGERRSKHKVKASRVNLIKNRGE